MGTIKSKNGMGLMEAEFLHMALKIPSSPGIFSPDALFYFFFAI